MTARQKLVTGMLLLAGLAWAMGGRAAPAGLQGAPPSAAGAPSAPPAAQRPAPPAAPPTAPQVPATLAAELGRMEAALAADPDNLRIASEYRHAVIRAGAYDRALDFFEKLVTDHPRAPFAWLNYGYVYVDKMPAAGAITQVILANDALQKFSRSIELKPSWLALYTRGNSYLYWPKVFGRGPLALEDLKAAVEMSKREPQRIYHVHAWAALGDAYWRTDQPEQAKATWEEGSRRFPRDAGLQARLARHGDELEAYIADQLDRTKRVDTDLHEIWEGR